MPHVSILSMVLTRGPHFPPSLFIYIHINRLENFNTTQASRNRIQGLQSRNLIQIQSQTMKLYSSLPLSNTKHPFIPCQSRFSCNVKVAEVRNLGFKVNNHSWPNHAYCFVQQRKENDGFVVGCAKWSLVTELERELEAEMNTQEDEEKASIGMARFRNKCGEGKGVVELLECLEREAIMGEDVGKEPMDYNRRAQIFDRSSRVFQALKEQNSDGLSQQ